MSLFYLHPDDRRWLKRWLRNNLVCFAIIVGFLLLLRFASMVPEAIGAKSVAGRSDTVQPEGWRRTTRGWEHTSTWLLQSHADNASAASFPIPALQPQWATVTMETVRRTSPLVIALIQIVLIGIIVRISIRRQHRV